MVEKTHNGVSTLYGSVWFQKSKVALEKNSLDFLSNESDKLHHLGKTHKNNRILYCKYSDEKWI